MSSRAQWEFETENLNMDKLKKTGRVNDEGYVNVADQLGLSGERGTRPSLYCLLFFLRFLLFYPRTMFYS